MSFLNSIKPPTSLGLVPMHKASKEGQGTSSSRTLLDLQGANMYHPHCNQA
jgi:hypothetical protein